MRAGCVRAVAALALMLASMPAFSQALPRTVDAPNVRVLDQRGERLRFADDVLADKLAVVNFFFTGCASVCPVQTAVLREARRRIADARVRFVSISVDPLNDTPARVADFVRRFDARGDWFFLTGDYGEVTRLSRSFEVSIGPPAAHASALWVGSSSAGWRRLPGDVDAQRVVAAVEAMQAVHR